MRNIKNRICCIDVVKICAIFGVLYNHCGIYMKFDFSDIMLNDVVSAVLSCLCKTAVPLFLWLLAHLCWVEILALRLDILRRY